MNKEQFLKNYHVKGIKRSASLDGGSYSCTLYNGQKRVCEVMNGGFGGPDEQVVLDEAEFSALERHIESLPNLKKDPRFPDLDLKFTLDYFAQALREIKDTETHLKKLAKNRKKLHVMLKDGITVVHYPLRVALTDENLPKVRDKILADQDSDKLLMDMTPDELGDLARTVVLDRWLEQ